MHIYKYIYIKEGCCRLFFKWKNNIVLKLLEKALGESKSREGKEKGGLGGSEHDIHLLGFLKMREENRKSEFSHI